MNGNAFQNKVAIVTGAGQGIGFEICWQLCQHGACVLMNDIDAALTTEAEARITKETCGRCIAVDGDCAEVPFIKKMVDAAVENFGKLDIAIANAGITLFGDFFTYTPDAFFRVLEVNLGGSFFLAQAAAAQMKTQKGGGSILFMSSVTGHQAHKDLAE